MTTTSDRPTTDRPGADTSATDTPATEASPADAPPTDAPPTDPAPTAPAPTDPAEVRGARTAGVDRTPLHGVVTPVVTPLLPDGAVDHASLERLVDHQLGAGVHGIFVLGTCGEGAHLTSRQRAEVMETAVARVAGRVPVLAGVIDTGTQRSIEHIETAVAAGVSGVVATAPFYGAAHLNELGRHFRLLAEAAGQVRVYAYDIPPRIGGGRLPAELLVRLAAEGVIAGVKDSAGQESGIRALLRGRSRLGVTDMAILTGSELTVDVALELGCDGVVPGLGNIDPAGYVTIFRSAREQDRATARTEQDRLFDLFDLVAVPDRRRISNSAASLGAFKTGLWLLGVIDHTTVVEPGLPLVDAEVSAIRDLLVRAGITPVR